MEVSLHQHHCKATCGASHGLVHGTTWILPHFLASGCLSSILLPHITPTFVLATRISGLIKSHSFELMVVKVQ